MSSVLPWLAALCATLVAAVVLWPLRRASARGARQHGVFLLACLSMGAAAACLYLLTGTPQAAAPAAAPAAQTTALREGVKALERSLHADPQRADGWALLGRSRAELGQLDAAATAFARAVQLAPDDAGVLVEAAQARAQAHPRKAFDDTALQWLQHARAVQPDAERAAWLLGIALRQRGRDADAVAVWSALLPHLQPAAATALRQQIDIAQRAADQAPAAVASVDAPAGPGAPSASGVLATSESRQGALQIRVALPAALDPAQWPAQAAVFVLARVPGGPPMPVAVKRLPLSALPAVVTLTDADSPMPTQPLSTHAQVEVLVRVSRSGSAAPGDGDVQSIPQPLTLPHAAAVVPRWPAAAER